MIQMSTFSFVGEERVVVMLRAYRPPLDGVNAGSGVGVQVMNLHIMMLDDVNACYGSRSVKSCGKQEVILHLGEKNKNVCMTFSLTRSLSLPDSHALSIRNHMFPFFYLPPFLTFSSIFLPFLAQTIA